jgi:hypothetical protein
MGGAARVFCEDCSATHDVCGGCSQGVDGGYDGIWRVD